jgi:PHD/YefM family antitoxin component YafN of YafNO toxin-antitoxin module
MDSQDEAETQEIVITRHGKPAGVLIGFDSEEDWFEYRLENDPRILRRIERARESLRAGAGSAWKTSNRNNDLHGAPSWRPRRSVGGYVKI